MIPIVPFHALAQLIRGCHDTAVLHRLDRGLVSDVNLDPVIILAGERLCHKICELLFFFKRTDDLLGALLVRSAPGI